MARNNFLTRNNVIVNFDVFNGENFQRRPLTIDLHVILQFD